MKIISRGTVTIIALFAAALHCHAQTNITLGIRAAADRTKTVFWNSQTGAVYQVESADLLTDVGAQGLQWVIRDADCASKGTNAEWMDVGDPQWLPRILHPIFQPQRFYRVKQVGQATLPPPQVSLQLYQGGSQLPSGTNLVNGDLDLAVYVTLTDTNQQISSVKLIVDGQKLYSVDGSFTASINTSEWPNGMHEIYAVATTADMGDIGETTPSDDTQADAVTNSTQLAIGISTSEFCVFSNYISQFFVAVPFFQAGQTQEVVAKFEQDSYWRVKVVDYQDTEVRRFEGQGTSAYAPWDGNDQYGSPLYYGYYDYIVEARPSQYGPLSLSAPLSSQRALSAESVTPPSGAQLRALPYKQTQAAMQFTGSNTMPETIYIPSLNPTNQASGTNDGGGQLPNPETASLLSNYPTSPDQALAAGLTSYFTQPPPMPPITTNINGVFYDIPWEEVYGPQPLIEVEIPLTAQEEFLRAVAGLSPTPSSPQTQDWPDDTYTTRTPTRTPGNLFFGFAGSVGIGYQGHHPKRSQVGSFGTAPGGVLASTPPWGPLKTAAALANGFSVNMGYAGWRTSFLLADDNLNSLDLAPVAGPATGTSTFATKCDFGLLLGHMTASAYNDPNYYATVPYWAVYNTKQPSAYQWIAIPGMDLGNGSVNSKLKWMAFYGCQSFNERDYTDLWTKFLLPMPPNLRLLLGSEDGVFILPSFGPRFAANLNGWTVPSGAPMTIFDAWCDAAADADNRMSHMGWYKLGYPILTRRMSAIYRDTTQGGTWNTLGDSIWGWWSGVSYDWFDVSFTEVQVYP